MSEREQSSAVLAATSVDAATYGTLIYEGHVFPLKGTRAAPQFEYERRVQGGSSTSFTRENDRVALIEVAAHDEDYALRDFTEYQFQLGEVGHLVVRGTTAEFHLTDQSTERVATETVSLPVVVGPTLYGFVARRWAALLAGERVAFRFAVISRLETIGFEMERVEARDGQVRLRMKATSPLIALIVDPLFITYTVDGELVALDGRVPTRKRVGNDWADFDAHVEYRNHAAFR